MSYYVSMMEKQSELMLRVARRLDEKGYAVVVGGLNNEGEHNHLLHDIFISAMMRYLKDIGGRRYPVVIQVVPYGYYKREPIDIDPWRSGHAFSTPFRFHCSIAVRERLRSIHAALTLVSARDDTDAQRDAPTICSRKISDRIEYRGWSREHLETFLRVLELPGCQAALKGNGRHEYAA